MKASKKKSSEAVCDIEFQPVFSHRFLALKATIANCMKNKQKIWWVGKYLSLHA